MKHDGHIRTDAIKGSLAGALGAWMMGQVTEYLYEHENTATRQAEDQARGGQSAYARGAERGAQRIRIDLSAEEQQKAGRALHWLLGMGAGALYAVLRRRIDEAGWAHGLGFGTGFWLLVDEGLVAVLGLTPGPAAFPWQTHARGWLGHLTFGLVVDTALDMLDRVA